MQAGIEALPDDLGRVDVERGDPASHAELTTRVADVDTGIRDERRLVIDSPMLMLPSCVRHTGLPIYTSSAMVWPLSILKMYLLALTEPPRFTTSQQATTLGFRRCQLLCGLLNPSS